MHGILKLRQQIVSGPDEGWRQRYEAVGTEELISLDPADAEKRALLTQGAAQADNVALPRGTEVRTASA